jgi:hypothetical protein
MKDDTVVALRQPETFSDDPLTEVLRAGARQLLGQAIEAEVTAHIEAHADMTDASGRRRIVRHGHMPEREVQTGIGAVRVKARGFVTVIHRPRAAASVSRHRSCRLISGASSRSRSCFPGFI